MKKLLLVFILVLSACQPSQQPIPTAIAQTQVIPTVVLTTPTIIPSSTPLPTNTIAPTNTPAPTKTLAPTETPVSERYLGDAVEKYNYALTALSVADPGKPGRLYKAENGKKLIGVEIIVSNVSGDPTSINPLTTSLVDSEGFSYEVQLGTIDSQLSLVYLNPGEKVRGWVGFIIPEKSIPASIKYAKVFLGNQILQASLTPPPAGHVAITQSSSPAPQKQLPKLGEVVEKAGYSLSATSVEDPAKPGSIYKQKNGYKLIAVEIIFGNVSGDTVAANPLDAFLVDNNGFVYSAELGGRDGQLVVAKLNPGEKVKGWVSFTIPNDAAPASIKYGINALTTNFLQTGLTK